MVFNTFLGTANGRYFFVVVIFLSFFLKSENNFFLKFFGRGGPSLLYMGFMNSCAEQGLLFASCCRGFPCCGAQLRCMGLAAPWHVGSSRSRDQTRVPRTVRQMLNHWTTREALFFPLLTSLLSAHSTKTS